MGTGSAFKRQTLQKHCPTKPHAMPKYERNQQNKPRPRFLQLVWSSASPAARPRPRSRVTKHEKINQKSGSGAVPEPRDSPDEPQTPLKVAEKAHRQPKQAKCTNNDDTNTPKKRQWLQKISKRNPKSLQKNTNNH